jgi:hypothetical protein
MTTGCANTLEASIPICFVLDAIVPFAPARLGSNTSTLQVNTTSVSNAPESLISSYYRVLTAI